MFPDYAAPIVRNAPDGVRELMLARWGMPGPPQFGGAPLINPDSITAVTELSPQRSNNTTTGQAPTPSNPSTTQPGTSLK